MCTKGGGWFLAIALALGAIQALFAQDNPRFASQSSAVIVDVVVLDKSRSPVAGLTEADFEVYEDGHLQPIATFDAVGFAPPALGSDSQPSPAKRAATLALAYRPPAIAALVFEQLGPSARQLASKAAVTFVEQFAAGADVAVTGVFAVDRAVHMLAPYGSDHSKLLEAIQKGATRAGQPIERPGAVPGAEYSSEKAGKASAPTAHENPYIRGRTTIAALSQIVDTLSPLPGRKAVVLFSEGLALGAGEDESLIPGRIVRGREDDWLDDDRHARMLRLVEKAARSRVAFYTFDSAGLRTQGPGGGFGQAPYVGLKFLADETGGLFFENTNDLSSVVPRVVQHLQQYYILTYRQPDHENNNAYHRIRVKVKRPGVRVIAREGYSVAQQHQPRQLAPNEVVPVLLLERAVASADFELSIDSFTVSDAGHRARTVVLGRVHNKDLTPSKPIAAGRCDRAVTFVGRVKSESRVAMSSEGFVLRDRACEASEERGGTQFVADAELAPGRHVVEVVAYDHYGRRSAIARAQIQVQDPQGVSDIVVKRQIDLPLIVAEGQSRRLRELLGAEWIPHLGDTVGADQAITFCVAASTSALQVSDPMASVASAGRLVYTPRMIGGPLSPTGRRMYCGVIPAGTLVTGTYRIQLTASQGDVQIRRAREIEVVSHLN